MPSERNSVTTYLTEFSFSQEKMDSIKPMMDSSGVGCGDAEWPNNVLSSRTVIYEDGKFSKQGTPVTHQVDPEELQLCLTLSQTAEETARSLALPSEASAKFRSFFRTVNADEPKPRTVDKLLIETIFAGTIFPGTEIDVMPLHENGEWWNEVMDFHSDGHMDEAQKITVQRWRVLLDWIQNVSGLESPGFIKIGDDRSMENIDPAEYPPGTEMTGSCFPRLIVGLTPKGSLVGLISFVVLT